MFAFKLHWIKLLHIAEDRVWNPNLLLTNSPKESVSQGYITKLWVPLSNPINAGILCYSTSIKPIPPWLREVEVLEDYVKVLHKSSWLCFEIKGSPSMSDLYFVMKAACPRRLSQDFWSPSCQALSIQGLTELLGAHKKLRHSVLSMIKWSSKEEEKQRLFYE